MSLLESECVRIPAQASLTGGAGEEREVEEGGEVRPVRGPVTGGSEEGKGERAREALMLACAGLSAAAQQAC